MRTLLTPALLAFALLLSGCGQKGPLFLPPPRDAQVPIEPEPTPTPATDVLITE